MKQDIKGARTTNKYYLIASTNFENKDFKSAKSNLLKYLNENEDYQALNLLGICHLNLKEFLEAANVFKKLISIKVISESIFNNYGIALKNLKELNTAKYYFKKSIELNNKNLLAYFNLGNLNLQIGREKEAEILFSKCLNIQKNYFPAVINLAGLHLKNYNLDKCLKLLINSLKIFPNNNIIIENLAKIYLIRKKFNLAEKYLFQLIQLPKENIKKIIPLALGYTYEGNEKEYKKICKLYIKKLSKNSSIFSFNHKKKKTTYYIFPFIRN